MMRNQYKILAEVYNQVNEATRANLPGMQNYMDKHGDIPFGRECATVTVYRGHITDMPPGKVSLPEGAQWLIKPSACYVEDTDMDVSEVNVYILDPHIMTQITRYNIGAITLNPDSEDYSEELYNYLKSIIDAVEKVKDNTIQEATRANLLGMQNYMKRRQEIMEKYVAAADEFWKIVEVLSQISQMPEAIELTKEIEGGISQGDEPQKTDLEYKFFNAFDRLASNNLSVGQHISPYDYI